MGGRVYRVAAVGTLPAVAPVGRVYRTRAVGTLPADRKGRVYRVGSQGTASVVLAPIETVTVEPMTSVEVNALLVGGTVADSYTWRQVSGPVVSLTGAGFTRSFPAPSAESPGATVVLGVRATVAGTLSAERTATVNVLPQITWMRTHADPVWRGCKLNL